MLFLSTPSMCHLLSDTLGRQGLCFIYLFYFRIIPGFYHHDLWAIPSSKVCSNANLNSRNLQQCRLMGNVHRGSKCLPESPRALAGFIVGQPWALADLCFWQKSRSPAPLNQVGYPNLWFYESLGCPWEPCQGSFCGPIVPLRYTF